ncbi:uncharacterized protein EI97DRAFT_436879 [Westerdykella ornata]|uniref:Dynactin subunit 5 n=1 Tax=Westerdykella ornata TaxID=318751 RepID=A0A6A6J8D3_WESOR|nr:uncharacterized protein EI97DRAFT_436879 [Westerdykella ornata]KAF2272507.1 hypothetical protein EI97DRAFT_436879 [Westerdykella ornata]
MFTLLLYLLLSPLKSSPPSHPLPLSQSVTLTPSQDSGNKVSRRAAITGTANITLGGRTVIMADVHLRGDLHSTRSVPQQASSSSSSSVGKDGKPAASSVSSTPTAIAIGRCTVISTGTVLRPPQRVSRGSVHFYPMKIGDNVFVGMFLFSFFAVGSFGCLELEGVSCLLVLNFFLATFLSFIWIRGEEGRGRLYT